MSGRVADQMGGMVLIEVRGEKPEKLLNLLMSRGVFIQDVQKREQSLLLKIRSSALESVQAISEEQGFELRVLRRTGAPVVQRFIKRHTGLLAGGLLMAALLYLGTSFIWFVDVEGNEKISREEILQLSRECGFYAGIFRRHINRLEVEEEMLRRMPRLTHAEIQIHGVKALIKVVERVLPPDGIQGPCDMVARCDGVIEEVLLQEGQAMVKKGDTVVAGQVLISGTIQTPEKEEATEEEMASAEPDADEDETAAEEPVSQQVRARGVVKARVWYESYGEAPIWHEEARISGREAKSIQVYLPWGIWHVQGEKESPYPDSEEIIQAHTLDTAWGEIGWKEVIWQEKTYQEAPRAREEALEEARKQAQQAMLEAHGWEAIPQGIQFHTISQPSDTVVRVQAILETVEDIAQAQAILPDEKSAGE